MMRYLFIACFIGSIVTGCGPRFCDYYPYHEDGRSKPAMVILPIQDKSDSGLCWDVAKEVDQYLRYKMMDDGNLYLLTQTPSSTSDHFGNDLSFAQNFPQSEFVVAMEVMEHKVVPYEPGKITPIYPIHNRQCDDVLMMKVRVRIIDVRCEKPTVVLQEIVQSNHMIPRDKGNLDYTSYQWGSDPYMRTPLALAHQKLAYDLVNRIETIVCGVR